MVLSKMCKAGIAGGALLAQAIAAGPALAGSFDPGPLDAAVFRSSPPLDSAVLRGVTAWTGDETFAIQWSWRQVAFIAFVQTASGGPLERSYGTPAHDTETFRRSFLPTLPGGLDDLGSLAGLGGLAAGGDSIRLAGQWHESTTSNDLGGTSQTAKNLALDVTLNGLGGFTGIGH